MIATYGPMFLMLFTATAIAAAFWGAATYLGRHRKPSALKNEPFECGSESTGGNLRLSVKFYLTAILFVVFDIEAVFIYPWAVQVRELGWSGYATMAVFAATLVAGLAYVWKKGALNWE